MKSKIVKNQGNVLLCYESSAQNPLDFNVVHLLESQASTGFMTFTVSGDSPNSNQIIYDITRSVTLASKLQQIGGAAELRKVLNQFKQVLDKCLELQLPLKNLELEYNAIYYDSWSDAVRFIYLPFEDIAVDAQKIRNFFADLPQWVEAPDAEVAQILMQYSNYFAENPMFNPIAFIQFLGELSAAPTEVDWDSVRENQEMRKADSPTTKIGPETLNLTPKKSAYTLDEAEVAVVEPMKKQTSPEQGAHARVDPGTTVLGVLAFNFDDVEGFQPDDTAVLSEGELAGLGEAAHSVETAAQSEMIVPTEAGNPTEAVAPAKIAGPVEMVAPLETAPQVNTSSSAETVSSSVETGAPPFGESQAFETKETVVNPVQGKHGAELDSITSRDDRSPRATFWLRRRSNGERVQIKGDRFEVGKSKYRDYQVKNTTTVSRSHAIFTIQNGVCWIEDDDSRNGTYIDNRRIDPHDRKQLESGSIIRMSDEEFEFTEERA